MDSELIGGFAICIVIGLFTIFMGWLIWKKEQYHLISGFNVATYKGDAKKLGKLFGVFAILIGALTMTLPFTLEFIGNWTGIVYGVITVCGSIYVVIKSNKLAPGK